MHFWEAYEYFRPYEVLISSAAETLTVTDEEWAFFLKKGISYTGQTEASLLTSYASDYLMYFNALIMHAVAFSFQGKAWLITGHSGAGKSTQVRNLQEILPGEFRVICGDRPVIKITEEGKIIVHPSPWNGKEGWHGADSAELAGIICLERGAENKIETLSLRRSVATVYSSFIHTAAREETILKVAALETKILEQVAVFRLESCTIPESSDVLFSCLFREKCSS